MLYRDNDGLKLASTEVKYTQHGVERTQPIVGEGTEWWIQFAKDWSHTQIISFDEIIYTEEQLERFEEIKESLLSEHILNDYVIDDLIGNGLEYLNMRKENERLKNLLADLTEIVLVNLSGSESGGDE